MAGHEEGFKTTFMGGFDKEDVLEQFRKQKEQAAEEKNRLQEELSRKSGNWRRILKKSISPTLIIMRR